MARPRRNGRQAQARPLEDKQLLHSQESGDESRQAWSGLSAHQPSAKAKGKAKAIEPEEGMGPRRPGRGHKRLLSPSSSSSSSSILIDGHTLSDYNEKAQQGHTKSKATSRKGKGPKESRGLALSDTESSSDGEQPLAQKRDEQISSDTMDDDVDDVSGHFVEGSDSEGSLHDADEDAGLGDWTSDDQRHWQDQWKASIDDGEFDIEHIVRWRRHPRKDFAQYRVKWKGYSDVWNSWEPACNFGTRKTIDDFWKAMELSGQGKRPKDFQPKYESEKDCTMDDLDAVNQRNDPDRAIRKAARRELRLEVRRDRHAQRAMYARMHALKEHKQKSKRQKEEESRLRKQREKEQARGQDEALRKTPDKGEGTSIEGRHRSVTVTSEQKRKSPEPRIQTVSNKRDIAKRHAARIEEERQKEIRRRAEEADAAEARRKAAQAFLPTTDAKIKDQKRKARLADLSAHLNTPGKEASPSLLQPLPGSSQAAALSSGADVSAQSANRSLASGSFRGAHRQAQSKVRLLTSLTAPRPSSTGAIGSQTNIESSNLAKDSHVSNDLKNLRITAGGWDDDLPSPSDVSEEIPKAARQGLAQQDEIIDGWADNVSASIEATPGPDLHGNGMHIDASQGLPGWDDDPVPPEPANEPRSFDAMPSAPQVSNSNLKRQQDQGWQSSKRTRFASASDPSESLDNDATMHATAGNLPRPSHRHSETNARSMHLHNRPTNANDSALPPPVMRQSRPPGPPPARSPGMPGPMPARSAGTIPSGAPARAPPSASETHRAETTASPIYPRSPYTLRSPASANGSTSAHTAEADIHVDRWDFRPLGGSIEHRYHVTPPVSEKDLRNVARRNALIAYIIDRGGGWKPEITDKMRANENRSVIWILDPSLPWGDLMREASRRHNFNFFFVDRPEMEGGIYEIWPFKSGKIRMFTFGALVLYVAHKAGASLPANDPAREEGELQENVLFRFESDDPAPMLVHEWQVEAMKALTKGKQLTTYLRSILKIPEQSIDEIDARIVLNAERVLDDIQEVEHHHTHLAQNDPFLAELDELSDQDVSPEILAVTVKKIDEEVHHTLRTLQVALRKRRRAFVLIRDDSSSLAPGAIGTCIEELQNTRDSASASA